MLHRNRCHNKMKFLCSFITTFLLSQSLEVPIKKSRVDNEIQNIYKEKCSQRYRHMFGLEQQRWNLLSVVFLEQNTPKKLLLKFSPNLVTNIKSTNGPSKITNQSKWLNYQTTSSQPIFIGLSLANWEYRQGVIRYWLRAVTVDLWSWTKMQELNEIYQLTRVL